MGGEGLAHSFFDEVDEGADDLVVFAELCPVGVDEVDAVAVELVGSNDALHVALAVEIMHAGWQPEKGRAGGKTAVAVDAGAAL